MYHYERGKVLLLCFYDFTRAQSLTFGGLCRQYRDVRWRPIDTLSVIELNVVVPYLLLLDVMAEPRQLVFTFIVHETHAE